MNRILRYIILSLTLAAVLPLPARELNDKLLNRPYTDLRRWHLGFSVGVQTQDVRFVHNGFVTESGEQWFMEQPAFSPGFTVSGLFALRLNDYFSIRFSPGMMFGNRDIRLRENESGTVERQNIKSAYVVTPVDVKFASQRFRNVRPYFLTGIMPAFDVSKRRNDLLKFKSTDLYFSVGLGCDFYLPYFKLIPELKFCFGLTDILERNRPDLVDDPDKMKYTQSIKKAVSQMVVLTFYFE